MGNDNILVLVFLRGGCDGLNLVAPSADEIYKTERRQESRVEREGDNAGLAIKNTLADADFRLHFKATGIKELYDSGALAIVHSVGLTNGTRSHFDAQDYIERGTPDDKNTNSGWLARLANSQNINGSLSTISLQSAIPISLLSCPQAVAIPNIRKLMQIQGNNHFEAIYNSLLGQAYQGSGYLGINKIFTNGINTLETINLIKKHIPMDEKGNPKDYIPSSNANYPDIAGEFVNPLKTLAQLIKMRAGVRIATVDYGGWDTHVGQAGRFPNLVDGLSKGLSAFWRDVAEFQNQITIVVMSEFGRRLKSNDSGGTDHGHGGVMMLIGAGVKGGNIYGKWLGLETENLDNQVDLAITTDFRTILSEVASKRFGLQKIGDIFPKFEQHTQLYSGIIGG